jgi:hypothetical protein
MTEEVAIIVAAVISSVVTVGGMFASIVYNSGTNKNQRKYDTKEKFFYEIYPKRLAVYEDVTKELMLMGRKDRDILNPHLAKEIVLKKIEDDLHTLDGLLARLDLYGSPAARNILNILRVEAGSHFQTIALETDNFVHECVALLDIVIDARNQFLEFIRKETGAELVDTGIKEIAKALNESSIKNKVVKTNKRNS